MEIILISLLVIGFASALPHPTGTNLKPTRAFNKDSTTQAAPLKDNLQYVRERNKMASFSSVASFCAAHPFAGGCGLQVEEQRTKSPEELRSQEYYDDNEGEDTDNTLSLLTVAFFCASHPLSLGCPNIDVKSPTSNQVNTDSENREYEDLNKLSDVMIRFCILHPSAYGCPKFGVIQFPPSAHLPLPLPKPIAILSQCQNHSEVLYEAAPPAQSNDINILTEYFNDEPELISEVEMTLPISRLADSENESHHRESIISGNQLAPGNQFAPESVSGMTGRSVGSAPENLTNDSLVELESKIDEALVTVDAFDSAKILTPKIVLSLPPPVDAIFSSGRYAWQKTPTPTRVASPGDVTKRLSIGKTKPLPSVKQVLGALAL